jgi:hypothetical protein
VELELEDAIRYPGVWRKVALITLLGTAALIAAFIVSANVSYSLAAALVCFAGGTVLVLARYRRLTTVAWRVLQQHPDYTPQQAANAARRELGLPEVRYR